MVKRLDKELFCIFLAALALRLFFALLAFHAHAAVFILQGIVGSFVVLMMHGVGSSVWSRKCGLIAAAISAVYPDYILYGIGDHVDVASVIFVTMVMALAAMKTMDAYRAFAQGLVIGFGMFIQASYLFFVPGVIIALRKALLLVAVCAGFAAAMLVGQIIAPGTFSPGVALQKAGMDIGRYAENNDYYGLVDRTYFNAMLLYKAHPGTPTVNADGSSERISGIFFIRKYSFLAVLLLGFVGLARYFRKEHAPVALPVLIFSLLLVMFMQLQNARFRSLLEPLLILYTSIVFCHTDYSPSPIRLKAAKR